MSLYICWRCLINKAVRIRRHQIKSVEFDPEQQEPGREHRKPIHTYSHLQFLTYFKISPPDHILSA